MLRRRDFCLLDLVSFPCVVQRGGSLAMPLFWAADISDYPGHIVATCFSV